MGNQNLKSLGVNIDNELKFDKPASNICLTFSCKMLQNGQTYFKNLAVWTPQDF